MPRPPRLHVPGGCYHVILRGNHREALFGTDHDRRVLDSIVVGAIDRFGARMHAFCWMSNHLHALIQVADQPLGKFMQRIAMRYARYRHARLNTTGHLFERRYRAKLVDVDAYFLTLLRYIHRNPVTANIVTDPAQYPWSSHRAYLGTQEIPWLTTDFGLAMFSSDLVGARIAYAQFAGQTADEDELADAVNTQDSRVLGSDRFVAKISMVPSRTDNERILLDLAEALCARHDLDVDLLRSSCRARHLTRARVELAREAIARSVASLSEIARFLGREPSALAQLLARYGWKSDNLQI